MMDNCTQNMDALLDSQTKSNEGNSNKENSIQDIFEDDFIFPHPNPINDDPQLAKKKLTSPTKGYPVYRTISQHLITKDSFSYQNVAASEILDFYKVKEDRAKFNTKDNCPSPEHSAEPKLIEEKKKSSKFNSLKVEILDLHKSIMSIRTKIMDMDEKLNTTNELLSSFIGRIEENQKGGIILDKNVKLPEFPITDSKILEEFNHQLLINKHILEQTAMRLQGNVTPINVKKSVKAVMNTIILPELLIEYTWTGKSGIQGDFMKKVFLQLEGIILLISFAINLQNDIKHGKAKIVEVVKEHVKRSKQNFYRECTKGATTSTVTSAALTATSTLTSATSTPI